MTKTKKRGFRCLNLFQLANIDCRSFGTCADLFDSADFKAPGCLLLDTNLKDISGFDAEQRGRPRLFAADRLHDGECDHSDACRAGSV
ncbi:response regulator transcription factor [Rhizobium leguminosarum]|uniref:hypothetical protein n=1 Tax=Rhizobium leguminosarum TaxID=384 RepID=UPI00103D3A69|nr:hypothetical protein [Rhizobium leguminosarum]MBB4344474.1 hypothetical protein [Rhizobium leguminosarum]MBB6297546.1 hypothetical protein [Rhizobium leguminosarum]NKM95874.1 hypothetical protein [Rhizobium leguminosarum bv. viciae]TCA52884.1 hypothetical protein E0H71_16615 [Rhizobium leguminosarum bv. viciae]TCA68237.1 hypothetical protein E0H69_30830 [Rhizobium leguminosarum bv. viciae]